MEVFRDVHQGDPLRRSIGGPLRSASGKRAALGSLGQQQQQQQQQQLGQARTVKGVASQRRVLGDISNNRGGGSASAALPGKTAGAKRRAALAPLVYHDPPASVRKPQPLQQQQQQQLLLQQQQMSGPARFRSTSRGPRVAFAPSVGDALGAEDEIDTCNRRAPPSPPSRGLADGVSLSAALAPRARPARTLKLAPLEAEGDLMLAPPPRRKLIRSPSKPLGLGGVCEVTDVERTSASLRALRSKLRGHDLAAALRGPALSSDDEDDEDNDNDDELDGWTAL